MEQVTLNTVAEKSDWMKVALLPYSIACLPLPSRHAAAV